MKLRLRLILGTVVLCFGAWLYANNTIERLYLQYFNSIEQMTDSTPSGGEGIDLIHVPNSIFLDDFESKVNWSFSNANTNEWYIGTAVSNGGSNSLYISSDKGVSNTYANTKLGDEVSFAISPSFAVPAATKDYIVSFDWRCVGDGYSWSVSDAFSVWLVPDTYTPPKNIRITPAGSGGVLLKADLFGQSTFKREIIKADLSGFAGTKMKIIFEWVCNEYTVKQPPAAIDNLIIFKETCPEPKDLEVKDIELDEATVNWSSANNQITDFELFIGTDSNYPTNGAPVVSVTGNNTHTFKNLNASTYYYVWYRSVCSATDKSYWVGPVKFMTLCGEFKAPFYETFDTDSPNVECWTFLQENPQDDTSFEISTVYLMDGDRGLMFNSYSTGVKHNSYAITPTFDFNGGLYKLTYYYKTSPSYNNEFEVLLSTKGIAVQDFTTVLVPREKRQKSEYVQETVFIYGITGKVNIAWHVDSTGESTFHLDNVRIESVVCTEPLELAVSNVQTDQATFKWKDDVATEWEYSIVPATTAPPSGPGIKVTQQTVVATQDAQGQLLMPDTEYDFYVRSKCLDGTLGEWSGPLYFKTACHAKNVPYHEGFDTDESDLACWTILDINKDATPYGNIWKQSEYTVYKGDRCMYYSGSSPVNDDWLISPGFNLTGGLYAVTFYYQLNQNTTANLEVKLSTTGIDPASFTQTIGATLPYKGAVYTKKTVYVEGVTGVANIGFHVTGNNGTIQIDEFSITKVTCRSPEDIIIDKVGPTSIDVAWTDNTNSRWEYYVAPDNGINTPPTGAGSATTSKSVTATRENGTNLPLQPNKEYVVYVRSSCGTGLYSEWIGPIKFRTGCDIMPLPYQEGFNSDSETQFCWKIVDGNNDKPSYGGYGEWFTTDQQAYEGDKSMYFTNFDSTNNDWLMSPLFKFDKTKIYRVTYMYRTEPGVNAEFEVRMANSSNREMSDYNKILLPNAIYTNVPWKQHKFLISDIDGEVSFAFYVSDYKEWGSSVYIDDFRIEEVTNCPEPLTQGADKITGTSAEIFWDNEFGNTDWEYFVRKKAFLIAPPLSAGTPTNTNRVNVTKDNFGSNLEGNTWYEFYVRSSCKDGSKTTWTGPYYFRTECTHYTLPFWEGFNGDDNSLRCWTKVNANSGASLWKQSTANLFEGSHSMNYTQSGDAESNDWFISPLFKDLDPTKTYRVKFNYKGTGAGANEMEVLASTKGTVPADFTQTIAPKMSYSTAVFKNGVYYFTGIKGDMYLAFRVVGKGAKNITIDNLFIDEVTTCGQPLNMSVKNVQSTSANLVWDDAFKATSWQYMIQETKQIAPTAKDAGTPTSSNDFVATKDSKGNTLKPNTDYVYYARTDCGNGTFSEWTGPIAFTTACDVYTVPYLAGFNSDSKELRCWTITQGAGGTTAWSPNSTWAYEGDRLMQFKQTAATAQADGYLISPTISFAPGTNYVLKYYYKTDMKNSNEFEVLLSTTGNAIANFTTTLLAKKAYNNDNYIQETIFISGISGNVNIAWHTLTKGAMTLGIDYVTIEKASSCPEPTNLKVINFTTNTIDVEWTQSAGITQWEVFVTEYGTPLPANATGVLVNGTPAYQATGLTSGKAYHIYVRAKCTGNTDWSNWSTPVNGPTIVTTNGGCVGALTIPVNTGNECIQTLGVSTVDSPEYDDSLNSSCMNYLHTNEMWFEFTATSSTHLLSFDNVIGLNKLESPSIVFTVYSGQCNALREVECFKFEGSYGAPSKDDRASTINGLVPGTKYYVRVGVPAGDFLFNICITTSEYNYVSVSKNGGLYSTEELVKDVLIQSDCDLVSNVVYKSGPNLGGDSFGYFNKNGSLFPFEEGIVLATHDISNTPGPYYDYGDAGGWTGVRGMIPPWEGDEDLNAVIESSGGSAYAGTKSVSTLEFDFIPIRDTIKFEYLMASMSYLHNCTVVCWGAGALFTAWLTELETGEGQNLALVPGTSQPITLSTVRDTEKSGAMCESVNPEFFGHYYGNGQDDPLLAPVNYVGMTKPMSSEPVYVKPGTKYRIKLAMADFCNTNHVSAVFFNARSFDLGTLDLGADLTVEANTAICSSESKIIRSRLLTENVEIKWLKDDEEIPGETKPDLEVKEPGEYKVVAHYPAIDCEVVGTIKVEMFKPLHEIIHQAKAIEYCRYMLGEIKVDLTTSETSMFAGLDKTKYNTTYYVTEEDAIEARDLIVDPTSHVIESSQDKQKRFVLVEDILTGCSEIFEVELIAVAGAKPEKPKNVTVCAVYEFPVLGDNLAYYEGPGATGKKYEAGNQLFNPGDYTIYVLQDNGGGCYEEVSYTVSITEEVVADVLPDQTYDCDVHILEQLSPRNHYFTEPGGKGTELLPGQMVLDNQTIYIYVQSVDGLCYDESSFKIQYEDCPIPKGISPNGDGLNDTFDLTSNGVSSIKIYNRLGTLVYDFNGLYTNQWHGQNKQNKQLPAGTYYYVLQTRSGLVTGWVQVNY